MIETVGTSARDKPVSYLRSLVEFVERRRGDAILLGEANVSPAEQQQYFELDVATECRCCSTSGRAPRGNRN